jgi:hypothetical protein
MIIWWNVPLTCDGVIHPFSPGYWRLLLLGVRSLIHLRMLQVKRADSPNTVARQRISLRRYGLIPPNLPIRRLLVVMPRELRSAALRSGVHIASVSAGEIS